MSKRKGKYYEKRAQAILEQAGYLVTCAGGSLGVFDLIALGPSDVRCIQVKGGTGNYLSGVEREQITAVDVPQNVTKECWRFPKFVRAPLIERL